jgi:rhomboid family GlyGly-CTERM serine protease
MKHTGIVIAGLEVGWFAIVLSGILLVFGIIPEPFRQSLYFTAQSFSDGQWWLLLSCQWVHLNFLHTVSNIAGVILLCVLILPKESAIRLALCTVSCLLSISVLLAFLPDLYAFYAGFSGVLYGLFFWGGISHWKQDKAVAALMLAAIIGKVAWDLVGPSAYERVDWLGARIAVEAHMAGIVGASVFVALQTLFSLRHKNNR